MILLTKYIFKDITKTHKKDIYTLNIALMVGIAGIIGYVAIFLYFHFIKGRLIDGDEYRLLFIPVLSFLSLVLLKNNFTGPSKILLIFSSLFLFSYFSFFFGNVTEEALLLNPIFLIAFSAFSSFIFKFRKEKFYYFLSISVLFILLLFFNEILAFVHPDYTFQQIVQDDLFIVRFAYILIFISINFIIYFSVKLNEKIQLNLDANNQELDSSRSNLLNQNIQLKQSQSDILNQNEKLKAFTEELQTKNEVIENKNEQLNTSFFYTKIIKDLLKNETKIFHQYFKDFFICDRPIAHVSSNLFWSKKINNKLYFVLADSNEAGTSSSVFSVLIIRILNLIAVEEIEVSEFLDKIYAKLDDIHEQSSIRRKVTGNLLDITLCCLNTDTNELSLVTVNQRVLLNRNDELIELQSQVNTSASESKNYSVETITLKTDDVLYLFTNACANQIGAGGQGKLTFTRFKKALQQITEFPLNIQKEKLENFMASWRGDEKQSENMKFVAIKID